ncbi:small membrane protein YldA [Phytobacter ursingii]|uniref:Small membrane protein YldA n=1 Tax=Phytobacter ursingii TaxID=1972431 RepID=A0AB35RTY4_9ENTR|nr:MULTISPECIES: small membrane protein YldA [Enterobacteriaceae]MDV2864070.1 small membrane protein YldA [Phytobacter ursingii]
MSETWIITLIYLIVVAIIVAAVLYLERRG